MENFTQAESPAVQKALARYSKSEVDLATAKQKLEQAKVKYASRTEYLKKQADKITDQLNCLWDSMISPSDKAVKAAEKKMWELEGAHKNARTLDLLHGEPTRERMKALGNFVTHFYFHSINVRELTHKRPGIRVFGFSDGSKDSFYLAYKGKEVIAALHVNASSHPGDTTYTHSYGIRKIKEPDQNYSRNGYNMTEWLNPEFVEFVGIKESERAEFLKNFKHNGG